MCAHAYERAGRLVFLSQKSQKNNQSKVHACVIDFCHERTHIKARPRRVAQRLLERFVAVYNNTAQKSSSGRRSQCSLEALITGKHLRMCITLADVSTSACELIKANKENSFGS